jgi:hypothetical protein
MMAKKKKGTVVERMRQFHAGRNLKRLVLKYNAMRNRHESRSPHDPHRWNSRAGGDSSTETLGSRIHGKIRS